MRDARAKLGEAAELPSVADMKVAVAKLVHAKHKSFAAEVRGKHARERAVLQEKVDAMRARHSGERGLLAKKQSERWGRETQERAERFRAGLRGLLDTVTGRARAIRTINEAEAIQGMQRDRAQRDRLIWAQLKERAPLQAQLAKLRERQAQERGQLAQEIVRHLRSRVREVETPALRPGRTRRRVLSLER